MPRALSEIYLEDATIDGVPYPSQGGHPISLTYLNEALSPLFPLLSGWAPAIETWEYASATTITVPSGATSRYQKGDKIRLKQGGGYKYFYIVSVADKLLTVTGGSDYTVANEAITDNYYSKAENPQGFPDWFNWTPTLAGAGSMTFTGITVDWAVFRISGKKCTCSLRALGTLGGTPSIQVTATLPITPAETNWPGTGWVRDELSVQALVLTASSSRIAIGKYDGSNYGLGSQKRVCAYIEYRY
jgi:hypothetical protein